MLNKFLELLSKCFGDQEVVEPTLHEGLLSQFPLQTTANSVVAQPSVESQKCSGDQEVVEPPLHEVLLKPAPQAIQPATLIEGGYKGGRERTRSSDEVWQTYSAEGADSATYHDDEEVGLLSRLPLQDIAASPVVQPGVELPDNDNKDEEAWQDYPIAGNAQAFLSQSPFIPDPQTPSTAFDKFMTPGDSDHNYGWYTQ